MCIERSCKTDERYNNYADFDLVPISSLKTETSFTTFL